MEKWQHDLDIWLTTPPENESNIVCDSCDNYIFPDEKVYEIDGYKYCEECAKDWLEEQAHEATREECYGL